MNFYIGPYASFTNGNASEEEQMTGKVIEQMVALGKSREPWFERVVLLGPDECQSSKHSVDLGNLSGDSNNEDRLQMHTEMIRIQKYLGKSCHHRIKCTAAAFLAALMWRRPLNSVFNHYRSQEARKDVQ